MIRNHLHSFYGWNDGNYPESEIEDLDGACPLGLDLNNLLSIKNYCYWARNLEQKGWEVDIHELIVSHSFVLNLDLSPLGEETLQKFEQMKTIKTERKAIIDQIESLQNKRDAIDEEASAIHKTVFKMDKIKAQPKYEDIYESVISMPSSKEDFSFD